MDPMLGDCSPRALRRRTSFKWRAYPDEVLPAFVAEMDFAVAEPIKDAVREALDRGDCGYPHIGELGEAFAAYTAERLGWAPNPQLVFAIPDVMTGVAEVLQAVTEPGAGVLINPPVYAPFFYRVRLIGRTVVQAPLLRGNAGGYDLDLEAIDAALSRDDVAAYLLCNPHNPVGRCWAADDLLAIADICARRGTCLLVDEIHAPLVMPGARHVAFGSLDHEMAASAFVFTSASKGWNIPGLKCGIAVTGAQLQAAVLRERWEALLAGHLGVLASVAAFAKGTPWLDAVLAQLDANRALLARLLSERLPEVGYLSPEASFLAWLDCRALGLGDDPAEAFLERGRVALSPGPDFGAPGFARLNIGTSPELIAEAVTRMALAR